MRLRFLALLGFVLACSPDSPPTSSVRGVVQLRGLEDHSGCVVTIGDLATTTAADGSYRIDGVPAGFQSVSALAPDTWEKFASAGVEVVKGGEVEAPTISLTPVGDIEGRVSVSGGEDPGGASVSVSSAGSRLISATPDASGKFRLRRVPIGSQLITASYPGRPTVARTVQVTYRGVVDPGELTIGTLAGSIWIQGRAMLRGETSHAGVVVSLFAQQFSPNEAGAPGATCTTDESGTFRFEGLFAGHYNVVATADSTRERILVASIFLRESTSFVDAFEFTPIGRLTGSVALAGGGDPKDSAVFIAGDGRAALTDAQGNWTLEDAPSGTWTVRVLRPGYATTDVADVAVKRGQTTSVAAVTLAALPPGTEAPVEVRGRAIRVGGNDNAGLTVAYGEREVVTGASGDFAFTGLKVGANRLEIRDGKYSETIPSVLAFAGTSGFSVDDSGQLRALTAIEVFPAERLRSGSAYSLAAMPDGAVIYESAGLHLQPASGAPVKVAAGLYASGHPDFPALQVSAPMQKALFIESTTRSLYAVAPDGTRTLVDGPVGPGFRLSEDGKAVSYWLQDGTARVATLGAAPKSIAPCTTAESVPPELSRDGGKAIIPACGETGATIFDAATNTRLAVSEPYCRGSAEFTPDGRTAFLLQQCGLSSPVVAVDLSSGTSSILPTGASACQDTLVYRGLNVTPDGKRLVYVGTNGALLTHDLTTGATAELAPSATPCSVRVTNTHVAYQNRGGPALLYVTPIAGGTPVYVGSAVSHGLSPDGSTLAFVDGMGDVWTASSTGAGAVRRFSDMPSAVLSFAPDSRHLVARSKERLAAVNLSSGASRTILTLPLKAAVQANFLAATRSSRTYSFQAGLYRAELP